jgi:hypothetical protein
MWANNIKKYLGEMGFSGVDWIDLAKNMGPVEGSCEHDN